MKNILGAAVLSLTALFGASVNAQGADFNLEATLASVREGCATTPQDCEALTRSALLTIRASGLSEEVINENIGAVVATVVAVSSAATPAVRALLASAVSVAADPDVGFVGNSSVAAAQREAATDIGSTLETGDPVSEDVVSQLGSGN